MKLNETCSVRKKEHISMSWESKEWSGYIYVFVTYIVCVCVYIYIYLIVTSYLLC